MLAFIYVIGFVPMQAKALAFVAVGVIDWPRKRRP